MSRTELEDGGDSKTERKYTVFESALKDLYVLWIFMFCVQKSDKGNFSENRKCL